jgi:hypothetical protein
MPYFKTTSYAIFQNLYQILYHQPVFLTDKYFMVLWGIGRVKYNQILLKILLGLLEGSTNAFVLLLIGRFKMGKHNKVFFTRYQTHKL